MARFLLPTFLFVQGFNGSLLGLDNHRDQVVRVFIFAGQSNMVGSDSKVQDIKRFPPYAGLEKPQPEVRFSYSIGRQNKMESWGIIFSFLL